MKKEEVIDVMNIKFKDEFSNNSVIVEFGPHGKSKYLKKYKDKKAKTVVVPDYISVILSKAFKGCGVEKIEVSPTVGVAPEAFLGCKKT